jgi:hypothetical protein
VTRGVAAGTAAAVTTVTSLVHTDFLARAQRLSFHFHILVESSGTVPVIAQLMQSGDGRNWQKKRATPEGSFTATIGSGNYVVMEPSALPSLQFVELSLTAGPGFISGLPTQPFAARIRIHATSRSLRRNAPASALRPMIPAVGVPASANLLSPEAATASALAPPPTPPAEPSSTPSADTLSEVMALIRDERGAGGDVVSRVASRLSSSASGELRAAGKGLAASPDQRAALGKLVQSALGRGGSGTP